MIACQACGVTGVKFVYDGDRRLCEACLALVELERLELLRQELDLTREVLERDHPGERPSVRRYGRRR